MQLSYRGLLHVQSIARLGSGRLQTQNVDASRQIAQLHFFLYTAAYFAQVMCVDHLTSKILHGYIDGFGDAKVKCHTELALVWIGVNDHGAIGEAVLQADYRQ